jgi:transcriptional regulator with XRE-family HTH domain
MGSFKENLKSELEYKGILIKDLATMSGVNRRTIDNYLSTHNSIPTADAAVSIAQVLGVSVEYLVTGRESFQDKMISSFSPDLRLILQIAEQLDKQDREIVLNMVKLLKKREDALKAG